MSVFTRYDKKKIVTYSNVQIAGESSKYRKRKDGARTRAHNYLLGLGGCPGARGQGLNCAIKFCRQGVWRKHDKNNIGHFQDSMKCALGRP